MGKQIDKDDGIIEYHETGTKQTGRYYSIYFEKKGENIKW